MLGGGITGLTTALLLKRAGLRVAVVEANRIGSGASGHNTAKVSALQATMYSAITKRHGHMAAADYARASVAGVEAIANLVATEGIDCDLRRRPAYTYAIEESERDAVATEAEAARQSGLAVVYDPGGDLDMPFPVHGSVRLDDQLAIHPVRYLHGLAAAVNGDGSRVFEHSRALGVRDGTPVQVRTANCMVSAERVVIATHAPLLDRAGYFARMEAIRSYCVAARLRTGIPPIGLAISAGDPAWSIAASGDRLIVGGQGHPAGQSGVGRERYDALESFARKHWDIADITHRWSAQDTFRSNPSCSSDR